MNDTTMQETTSNSKIASAIYRPLVDALFNDTLTMMLGCLATIVGIFLTALHTQSYGLFLCAFVSLAIAVARGLVNVRYQYATQNSSMDSAAVHKWEVRYTIGAVATTSTLGFWCFYSMVVVADPLAASASSIITFANLVGVSGRNYPIVRLMNLQVATAGLGVFVGIVMQGGLYVPLAMLMLIFILSIHKIGGAQRKTLFSALIEGKKSEKLASQFFATLDNIPEAVLMFNAARRLEVANSMASKALRLPPDTLQQMHIDDLLNHFVLTCDVKEEDAATILKILGSDSSSDDFTFGMRGTKQRTIRLRSNPMDNGGIVATFEDLTHEVEAASKIDRMFRFDRLTGLINREELQRTLVKQLNENSADEQCSVLLINLDRFKHWNEELGHSVGDFLLCEATRRIKAAVGDAGYCARYGGDEFAVAMHHTNCLHHTESLADRIIAELDRPVIVGRNTVSLACSIGISTGGRNSESAETLLQQADMALLWAKHESRGQWRVFDRKMSQEMEERRKLEKDLRSALSNGELETYYQPLVSVKDARITTCEALLRWKHPENGFVSPEKFIPLAEEIGVIEEIGAWVLRDACQTCATWPAGTHVAVNLSAVQFAQGDIVKTVREALRDARLHPTRLELEITESLMLSDMEATISRLNEFIAMGVRISLDDFGTGYSSLSYMNDLPLNKVKIDRSFVQDIKAGSKSLTLVQAICTLGRELELSVVVEGVETADQLQTLVDHADVTEIQGYYFSKPVSATDLSRMLDRKSLENEAICKKLPAPKRLAA